jgi:hypothetical protein
MTLMSWNGRKNYLPLNMSSANLMNLSSTNCGC